MIISHVKIIAFQLSLFCKNYRFSKTVLYIINRKIHGCLEIPEINLVFPRTHVLFSIYFGCISLNIACKFKCYVSKYKLVLAECDDFYFIDIAIAFIAFTLHEIFGTLGMLM
jgi:hypothetical protein